VSGQKERKIEWTEVEKDKHRVNRKKERRQIRIVDRKRERQKHGVNGKKERQNRKKERKPECQGKGYLISLS